MDESARKLCLTISVLKPSNPADFSDAREWSYCCEFSVDGRLIRESIIPSAVCPDESFDLDVLPNSSIKIRVFRRSQLPEESSLLCGETLVSVKDVVADDCDTDCTLRLSKRSTTEFHDRNGMVIRLCFSQATSHFPPPADTPGGLGNHHTIIGSQLNFVARDQYNVYYPDDVAYRAILTWLSPLDFDAYHTELSEKRVKGTGRWFLQSPEFMNWRDGTSGTLWCPGPPGAGKSVLTSIVVDHLQGFFVKDNVAIACIYFNHDHDQHTVPQLLANLLKQLIRNRSGAFERVRSLYRARGKSSACQHSDEFTEALNLELKTYSKVFVIIDALDRCAETGQTQADLLSALRELSGSINLMITSRHSPLIAENVVGAKRFDVYAHDEDIKIYTETRLVRYRPHLKELREVIVKKMVSNAKGMFLLVQLYLDLLEKTFTVLQARKVLANLPKKLDDLYEEALCRIKRQGEYRSSLAEKVLTWISYAFRLLSVKELQQALAFPTDPINTNAEATITPEFLTMFCAGLVVIERNTVRLVHYTAEKYFERNRERLFPDGQTYIAATCLKYLLRSSPRLVHCRNGDELERSLEHDPLFMYAGQYWGHHAGGKVEAPVRDLIRDFLGMEATVTLAGQVLLTRTNQRYFAYPGQPLPIRITGIHIFSAFGLLQTITDALCHGADPDSKDSDNRTPLSWAAEKGQSEVVKLLLTRKNVDVNSKDSRGETPLSWAVNNRQVEVVRQLLTYSDLDVNTCGQDGLTPLWSAAIHGYIDVMELLLSRDGVDPNLALPRYGPTMLWWAARTGREATVQTLLRCDKVSINSRDSEYGQSPLSSAAGNGHAAVVTMLLEQSDVDANSRDERGRTPLSLSAEKGHESVMKLLLGHPGIEVKSEDVNGRTPLWWAAKHGQETVVEMLLGALKRLPAQDGIGINSLDKYGRSPLWSAVEEGLEDSVKMLLARDDVDLNVANPLFKAAIEGRDTMVKLLLGRDDIDLNHGGALSCAARHGHVKVVEEFLLHHAIGCNTPRRWAKPLSESVDNGHQAVVSLLLSRNEIDLNEKVAGKTSLFRAAHRGGEAIVKLLLDREDIDVNLADERGQTPLSTAAEHGHREVVRLLLDRCDISVDQVDKFGKTPLHYAAQHRHELVAKELLDAGANPAAQSVSSSLHGPNHLHLIPRQCSSPLPPHFERPEYRTPSTQQPSTQQPPPGNYPQFVDHPAELYPTQAPFPLTDRGQSVQYIGSSAISKNWSTPSHSQQLTRTGTVLDTFEAKNKRASTQKPVFGPQHDDSPLVSTNPMTEELSHGTRISGEDSPPQIPNDGHNSELRVPAHSQIPSLPLATSQVPHDASKILFTKEKPARNNEGEYNLRSRGWFRNNQNRTIAVNVNTEDFSEENVIIAVIGPRRSGKSSFIHTATGGGGLVGHELESSTTEISVTKFQCPERSDLDILFVDTPGFDDANISDVEVLDMIAEWLKTTSTRNIKLSGILYFHRISDNRMVGSPLRNLRMFEKLCGKNALRSIILTTTMWDEVDESVGSKREKELKTRYWKAMIDQGSKTVRYTNSSDSAWKIMDDYLTTANNRYAVLLQQEMVDMERQLRETKAGKALYETLDVLVKKQQNTLGKIRSETKRHGDDAVLTALKEEYDDLRKQLDTTIKEMSTLKIPLGRRIMRMLRRPLDFMEGDSSNGDNIWQRVRRPFENILGGGSSALRQ